MTSSTPSTATSSPRSPAQAPSWRPSPAATCGAAPSDCPADSCCPRLREITGNPELAATEWDKVGKHQVSTIDRLVGSHSFADAIRSTADPATEQEWRVRAASAGVDLR